MVRPQASFSHSNLVDTVGTRRMKKLPQQEPAGIVGTACPALRSLRNPGKRMTKFCIQLEGCVRAALKIPIKRRVIFGGGFLMKFHNPSGHETASPNCDCELRT